MTSRMNRLWWRVEWALWQKLLPRRWHAWLMYLTTKLLGHIKGNDLVDHWIWEITPYPAGSPFIRHYLVAFRFMLSGRKRTHEIICEEYDRFDREWDEMNIGKICNEE